MDVNAVFYKIQLTVNKHLIEVLLTAASLNGIGQFLKFLKESEGFVSTATIWMGGLIMFIAVLTKLEEYFMKKFKQALWICKKWKRARKIRGGKQ